MSHAVHAVPQVYPTLVIRGTGLYELWKRGLYKNYPPDKVPITPQLDPESTGLPPSPRPPPSGVPFALGHTLHPECARLPLSGVVCALEQSWVGAPAPLWNEMHPGNCTPDCALACSHLWDSMCPGNALTAIAPAPPLCSWWTWWRGSWRWCRPGCASTASSATSRCRWSAAAWRRATCGSWPWRAWGTWASSAATCARARPASRTSTTRRARGLGFRAHGRLGLMCRDNCAQGWLWWQCWQCLRAHSVCLSNPSLRHDSTLSFASASAFAPTLLCGSGAGGRCGPKRWSWSG